MKCGKCGKFIPSYIHHKILLSGYCEKCEIYTITSKEDDLKRQAEEWSKILKKGD